MPALMESEAVDTEASINSTGLIAELNEFSWKDFLPLVQTASESALLLDFDGTLAPFRLDPSKSRPWAGVVALLDAIQRTNSTRLAIVSGRPTASVMACLGMSSTPEIW